MQKGDHSEIFRKLMILLVLIGGNEYPISLFLRNWFYLVLFSFSFLATFIGVYLSQTDDLFQGARSQMFFTFLQKKKLVNAALIKEKEIKHSKFNTDNT